MVESDLRASGNDLLTKLGSAVPMLPKPETHGHVLDTTDQEAELLASVRARHNPDFVGDLMVGATGIEPVTPPV